jgi:hypothetical protein
MAALAFHHLFVFTQPGAPEVDLLARGGFREGPPNAHPGQGTANRRVFFANGMLEFIRVQDREEALSAVTRPTRLDERSRYRQTGWSPFGICLVSADGRLGDPPPFAGWSYRPGYLPAPLGLWMASNEAFPWEPAIFQLIGASSAAPGARHPNGAGEIHRVRLQLAAGGQGASEARHALGAVPGIELGAGPQPAACVELRGTGAPGSWDLGPGCPLRVELLA